MKERKKPNKTCKSKPIHLKIFLIDLLCDKIPIEYTQYSVIQNTSRQNIGLVHSVLRQHFFAYSLAQPKYC